MPTSPQNPRPPVSWNDMAILEAAGKSPESVSALLARNEQPAPSDWAVYQWWSRRKIPDMWRPRVLFALLREDRITVSKLFRLGTTARRATPLGRGE